MKKNIITIISIFLNINKINSQILLTENNHISIRGTIDDELISNKIIEMNKLDDNNIYIYLQTNGGSVMAGYKFIESIDYLKKNGKNISCIGDISISMGFVIFQHCDYRFITKSSILMQHQMSLELSGSINNLNNYLIMINDIKTELDVKQSQRLELSMNDFNNLISNDWWIFGTNNLKYRTADVLTTVGCNKNLINTFIIEKINTIFGNIIAKYSACPTVRSPLEIKYEKDDTYIDPVIFVKNLTSSGNYFI